MKIKLSYRVAHSDHRFSLATKLHCEDFFLEEEREKRTKVKQMYIFVHKQKKKVFAHNQKNKG